MNITTAGEKIGISAETIRYYEKTGLVPPITRDEKGYRIFSENDLDWLFFAKKIREAGVSIDSSIEYVNLLLQGESQTSQERKAILFQQKQTLEEKIFELNTMVTDLNHKIEDSQGLLQQFETTLANDYQKRMGISSCSV
ncbi:MerR family transcriptional regulator [Enterococcus sp. HY326]|uniref:MerR family transcriptional regulator n=1 Tax=Enterococcus sp. HY326 TaxID=2971265 RepID=UPI0022407A7D|nr:MerR family transcriptional regulator [Enterococcus sp. HY326]